MEITLEAILAVVIILITLNLLVVGVYVIRVLKEALSTIRKAQVVIDDVDISIKDGVEKMKAMEKPLQAMAITSEAVTGVFKTAGMIGKKVMNARKSDVKVSMPNIKLGRTTNKPVSSTMSIKGDKESVVSSKKKKSSKPKFFKKKK